MNLTERILSVNWERKLWHVAGGTVIIATAYLIPWPWTLVVASLSFLLWVSVEAMRRREPWFGRLFFSISAPFVRGFERRKIIGNTWTALAATIITGLFHDPVFVAGAFVGWTFADPAAEIFGKIIPSTKYFDDEKSVAGSIGCFLMACAGYAGFFQVIGIGGELLPAVLTVAAATTLAESFSTNFTINDNFLMPVVSALALTFVLR